MLRSLGPFTNKLFRLPITPTGISYLHKNPSIRFYTNRKMTTPNISPDSIESKVKEDHGEIFCWYDKYLALKSNPDEQKKWMNQLIWEIARHSVAEEIVLYPVFEDKLPNGKELADENRRQHDQVKAELYIADAGKVSTSQEYDAILARVIAELKTHIQNEEEVELVQLRNVLSEEELCRLGKQFEMTKLAAPTHPHTTSPSTGGIGEKAMGLLIKPMDKLRDALRSFPTAQECEQAKISFKKSYL